MQCDAQIIYFLRRYQCSAKDRETSVMGVSRLKLQQLAVLVQPKEKKTATLNQTKNDRMH